MRNWHGNLSPFGKWHTAGSRVFSPAILFAGGEQGVWYDPSDLDTLFQDTAGTTPVTTAGQTVALMLDKSKGLTLGPEEITNGTFDSDVSGWTVINGDFTSVDGEAVLTYTGSAATVFQQVTVESGKSYRITGSLVSATTASPRLKVGSSAGSTDYKQLQSVGDFDTIVVATTNTISFYLQNLAAGVVNFDNISVKELPGYHATQPTAAARPTYQTDGNGLPYLFDDEVDDSLPATTPDLGTDATLAYATDAGTTILTGQTIGAGSFEALRGVRTYAVIAVDRALTTAETTSVTAYLDQKRGAL